MIPNLKLNPLWSRRLGCALLLAAGLQAWASVAGADAGGLKVLARYDIPNAEVDAPTDIRWATDESVFLARSDNGVHEVALTRPLQKLRNLVPDTLTLKGPNNYRSLAASSRFLAVAAVGRRIAWRPVGLQKTGAVGLYVQPVNTPIDIDLAGDRILILGDGRDKVGEDKNGGIAFLGKVSATGFKEYRPVLMDPLGANTPSLLNCSPYRMGSARFLPDGSFIVVPGFRPGAHLFARDGRLLHTWSAQETGLSTDCARLTKEQSDILWGESGLAAINAWMQKERILDDVLPLAEGPGLLVRSATADGGTAWELRILRTSGEATVYKLPVTGGPEDRLTGDVRGSRIVLLRSSWHHFGQAPRTAEILVLGRTGVEAAR
ncbi:MAG TPA: hypothetical protein VHN15_11035 [Thermoanaerobaculia bacterium]|nr:hypothetical protein [Thermoanaerobaculia bacterium]